MLTELNEIEIKLHDPSCMPNRATTFAVGCDISANLTEENLKTLFNSGFRLYKDGFKLPPLSRASVPTGIWLRLPKDVEAQIRPRSGNAIKLGLTVLNAPGTIDPDYSDEVKVIVYNSDPKFEILISNKMKIAQMVFKKFDVLPFKVVDELSDIQSNRTGGFGHTDKTDNNSGSEPIACNDLI